MAGSRLEGVPRQLRNSKPLFFLFSLHCGVYTLESTPVGLLGVNPSPLSRHTAYHLIITCITSGSAAAAAAAAAFELHTQPLSCHSAYCCYSKPFVLQQLIHLSCLMHPYTPTPHSASGFKLFIYMKVIVLLHAAYAATMFVAALPMM